MFTMRAGHRVVFIALLLCGCAGERPQRAQPRADRPTATSPRAPSAAVATATYVANASSIDLFIIGSSELALQRSSAARVREFATMMVSAHKGTSAQLSFAGRRLNLLPSATLQPRHQAMLNELQQSANLDAVYRRHQVAVHDEALHLHSTYAARGTSPTMRPVAKAIVPVIQRHTRLLNYL